MRVDRRAGEQADRRSRAGPGAAGSLRPPRSPGQRARSAVRVASAGGRCRSGSPPPTSTTRRAPSATTVVANVWSGPSVSQRGGRGQQLQRRRRHAVAGAGGVERRRRPGRRPWRARAGRGRRRRAAARRRGVRRRDRPRRRRGRGDRRGVVSAGRVRPGGRRDRGRLVGRLGPVDLDSTRSRRPRARPGRGATGSQKARREPWRASRRPTVHLFRLHVCGHCAGDWARPAARAYKFR